MKIIKNEIKYISFFWKYWTWFYQNQKPLELLIFTCCWIFNMWPLGHLTILRPSACENDRLHLGHVMVPECESTLNSSCFNFGFCWFLFSNLFLKASTPAFFTISPVWLQRYLLPFNGLNVIFVVFVVFVELFIYNYIYLFMGYVYVFYK